MDVLKLLQNKSRCLAKLLKKSQDFLAETTFDSVGLQTFQDYRDKAFKAIGMYDNQISNSIDLLSQSERTPTLIQDVKSTQFLIDKITREIIETDQKILSNIETERSRLLQELLASEKNLQTVKKFKSVWVSEPGENLDGKL